MSDSLKVFNQSGAEVGALDLREGLIVTRKGSRVVHEAVLAHLAARRAGTAATKEKWAVAGSGKKPWKQKGTGRARAGYRQSPVWRGGGTSFGPLPRDYSFKVNKKEKRLAFRLAFSERFRAGDIRMLEQLTIADGKTKTFAGVLKSLDVKRGALLIVDALDASTAQAVRNIPRVEVVEARNAHTYQLLRYPSVLITRAALVELEKRLIGEAS